MVFFHLSGPDPDPQVRGTDPDHDPDPPIIKKIIRKPNILGSGWFCWEMPYIYIKKGKIEAEKFC
jgi:hypothetical protein